MTLWQHPIFASVSEAAEVAPQAILKVTLDYQATACSLPLNSQRDFKNAVDELQPLVDRVETAIADCKHWKCPVALCAAWEFMLKDTIGRPAKLQSELRANLADLRSDRIAEAELQKGWLERYGKDMKEEFRGIQMRILHDLGILAFILADSRKKTAAAARGEECALAEAARAATRLRTENLQRQQTQALNQDQLQAFIASRLSRCMAQK